MENRYEIKISDIRCNFSYPGSVKYCIYNIGNTLKDSLPCNKNTFRDEQKD